MIKAYPIIVLSALAAVALTIAGIGLNPIRPLKLNKGSSTPYMFFINPETQILTKAKLMVTFPSEFDKTTIASNLSCMSSSLSYAWKTVSCRYSFSNGAVIVDLETIKNEQTNVLISQPRNPTIFQMSSFFSLCLMVDTMVTTCDKTFGKVVFPNSPQNTGSITALFPVVSSLNSRVVGQSSTYQFRFSFDSSYASGNTVRITFPVGFETTTTPICQVSGTFNQVITTFVWPDKRTVECRSINKTLYLNESLKVIGILNPNYAGTFGNTNQGFLIEILERTTTIVLQQMNVMQTVTITAGTMTGYIAQANNFIEADVQYTFYLNLLNSLTSRNFILIRFDNSWILYQEMCEVISGITMAPKTRLRCTNSTQSSFVTLNVSGFQSASVSNQLVFSIKVRSPNTPNTYTVLIQTANSNGILDSMTATVTLNSTYGDYKMLSINAIVAQSDVPVSGTGPLELTFFLNYELPQTNVLTEGKFLLRIYPQIPLPPPLINGVLKCYFFNTIPAQTCTWDTSNPAYTLVTINTPLNFNFQYSQIPVTITTEGAVNSSKIGITIADIVTRYRFQLQAYMHNNTVTPTEVYFSEYIAAPIEIPLTSYSLTKEINEKTHLRFQFISPYNFTSSLAGDLRIKIEFLSGGAWAPNLGYNSDTIYKRFPCVFTDNRLQTVPPQYNADVTCDLYTYMSGPHASLTNSSARGPYILVSGFTNQMFLNSEVRLQVGGLLIGSSTNLKANIRFSLVQETPTMLTKYVQLYYNQFALFTTSSQAVATAGSTGVSDSIGNPLVNTVSNHTITYNAPSNFFAVIYQFDQISTPSFPNQFVSCTRINPTTANWCTYLGYPVNWIIQYSYLGSFSSSISSVINITSGRYSGTFIAQAKVYSSASLTLMKTNFNVVYTPRTITSAGFYSDGASSIYKGSELYYYVDFYPITSTPDGGFIRLIFGSYGTVGQNPYCTSSQLQPLVSELGILCTVESSTSLKIYNIRGLTSGSYYRIVVRLSSSLSSGSNFRPTVTIQTHYSVNADPSIVDTINNQLLNTNPVNYHVLPNEFKINNPRVTFEPARVGYIGKFELQFSPSGDVLSATSIRLIFNNHAWNGGLWTTPNAVTSDPLVCLINSIRVGCSYTLSPLTVTMNVSPAGITNGQINTITLDTEYLSPWNGIKHPSQGGQYNLYLQFLDNSSSIIQKQSFYHQVLPPKLRNFYANSSVNDVGVQNMFYVQFQLGSTMVNAFNDGTMYSRIFIEFPTVDSLGNNLFANNLGGYRQTGDLVGCVFDTWTTYYVDPVNTYRLQCRLIMSEVPGDPVRVEVLHHSSFSSSWRYMRLWIAKVFNPTRAVTSVPISIRIEHVQVSTNNVYELYYDTFDVFMNSQSPPTPTTVTDGCQSYYTSIMNSGPINHVGYFRIAPRVIGSIDSTQGYYFVIDTTDDFKPMPLESYYGSNYCHGSYFWLCLSFPDINYIIIWSFSSNYYADMYVQFGPAISQTTTNMIVKIWNAKRYVGNRILQITPTCWNQIRSAPSSVSLSGTTGSGYDYYENKRRLEVVVTFAVEEPVPSTGSIEIKFPTSVPRIYPHCRSMTNLGSSLAAEGTSENGQVGCLVQNTRSWVITGFNALSVGNIVKVVGFIDLPGSNGYLGAGQIITYNNTHPTNIRSNGFIIDYQYDSNFFINVNDNPSQNVDSEITLDETLPLRTSYIGPLRFKFTLASALNGPNQGKITVRLPGVSTLKVNGGFTYSSSAKYVCQIIQVSSYEETGCIITDVSTDSNPQFPNFMFTMITSSTLNANILYKLVISTHSGVQPEGLLFPTVAGTYKVDFNFDTTGSTGMAIHNQLYLEVYGTKFSYILCQQFNSIPGKKNLIWFKITPTTTIQTTQQIIIEVPTKSSAGSNLFADDLGTGILDGGTVPVDILAAPFSSGFMSCRLFRGDQANYKPAKIVCGKLQGTVSSSQVLWFAIVVYNPSIPNGWTKVSIPFFLYSVQQGTTYRTNFDVIENAVYLRADYATTTDMASPISQYGQLQTSGVYLDMITRNQYTLSSSEYYVVFFKFPLRNNGLYSNACTYPSNGAVYGDAIYHLNIWAIVCSVTSSTSIGVPSSGSTTRNLRIANFFTPFYFLSASQRQMEAYGYHFASRYTSFGNINDGYPNQGPKTSSTPSLTITPLFQTTLLDGVRDDYTFSFTFSSSANNDLSFVKKIALIFPSVGYGFVESDCYESPSSQVEIAECFIDTSLGVIWIRPVQKASYTSDMVVSITTRNRAIRNPVSSNTNNNQFTVKYYTWQNITEPTLSPTSNNNYCYLIISNFPSSSITFSSNPSGYEVTTFSYIDYPHQRYYQETPFSSVIHRAPIEMEFYPAIDFNPSSGTNYHMIKVAYPSSFGDAAMFKIRDLQVFRPVCYLNNQRIRQCQIDTTANEITMSFIFGIYISTKYHLKVSIMDSRNADVNGFLPSTAISDLVLLYRPYGTSTWRYTQTDQFPSLYSLPTGAATGPFRGIIAGTATYGHTVPNQLNYLNMLLTFNRTDITGLVFEIPSVDKNGNALFSSSAQLYTTFLNQENGGSYPCGNNGYSAGGKVRCILLRGSESQAGVVTRIIMSEFTYVTQMNCRFVFKTPPIDNTWFSVIVKAYGGLPSSSNPYGNQFMGEWEFNEIFQVNSAGSASSNTYTANYYQCPNLTPWRNNTSVYVFSQNTIIGAQRSSVAELLYYDEGSSMTDKLICEPSLGSNNNYDDLLTMTISTSGVVKKYAYFVTTYQSNTNVSTSTTYGWTLQYLKCKYFANFDIKAFFYYSDTSIQVATNSFSSSYCDGYSSGISSPSLVQFSQSHYNNNGTPITYVQEFDLTGTINSISNFGFRSGDQMVLKISYNNTFWGTVSDCTLLGGVMSTSLTQVATCNVGSNSVLYISNIGGFIPNPQLSSSTNYRVKVAFTATGVSSTSNININFYMVLYANIDAYNNNYQGIFYEYNSLSSSNTLSSCYWYDTSTCVLGQSTAEQGTFLLRKITDTYLEVVFAPSGNLDFSTNAYINDFILTFNGFTFGTSCSVSDIKMQMSNSATPGTGVNNSFAPDNASCGQDWVEIILNSRQWGQYWGGAVDNVWTSSEYLIFYITIAPNAATADLPNLNHDYIFLQGSYSYRINTGTGWTRNVFRSLEYTPQPLADSATISTLTTTRGAPTEFSFTLRSLKTRLGPQNNNYYLLAEFIGTSSWTGAGNPFASYTNPGIDSDELACKCISGSNPLTVSASSSIIDTVCKRRVPTGTFTNFAIIVQASATANQDLICFFPQFTISSGMNFNVEFKLVYQDNYPQERSSASTKYSSVYRVQSNSLTFSGSVPDLSITYASSFSSSEGTNFYSSATNVGSTFSSTYTLSGNWGTNLNTPYIYINFKAAGPIPIYSFCSDINTFLQCRVYTNKVYLIVAQLKSTSVSSYSITSGGSSLQYPPSQFSVNAAYGASIYVGSGSWQRYSSLSRSKGNLAPISSNSFLVFSDRYGSRRSSYATNIFFSINPSGQTLYNYALTGSKMVISWSSQTTSQNCQVWVENQPLVNLECEIASSTLTITSPYYDFTTSNNIMVSMGIMNPTSSSVSFSLLLYSSFFSSSWNYLTISNSATYSIDTTYTSGIFTQVSKSSVEVYPFQARISTVANAPLRIRFRISSSSIANTWGQLTLTYSQIGYSSSHLCYIIAYNSYASMMQQTQRKIYRVSCSSSSSIITIIPSVSLTISSSNYYELVMMPLNINTAGCTALGCITQSGYQQTNFDTVNFIAYSNRSAPTIVSQQVERLYSYEGTFRIGMQHIYILCVQPRTTSLYLSISLNFTSSQNFPSHYLEVTLYDLTIAAVAPYAVGDIFPCQLSPNFLSVNARKSPQCRVASANLLNGFIKIRIENIGFITPQTYWISLDDIVLPTPSGTDNNNKFDISVTYFGPSNVKYENYFPEIFQVDNTNNTSPVTTSTYTFNNPALTGFGNPITGQIVFSWPFDTTSSSYETKIALNFNGGYSAVWQNIDTVSFVDSAVGTYTLLWVNKALNKFVFLMPNKGNAASTTLNITGLNNPYPYQREAYNADSNNIDINFYNNHFLQNSRTFIQPSFAIFTMNPSLIFINQNSPTNQIDNYPSTNSFAPGSTNFLILSVEFNEIVANIQARSLGIIRIKFTSGVSYIRECRVMRNNSQYVNNMTTCQSFHDGSNWNVYLRDVTQSQVGTGWWVQVLANYSSATLAYTSYVICQTNNVVEYQNSYTITLSGYNTSRAIPTVLSWLDNRYVLFFHQTQYRFLDAVSGQRTPYLRFRFTAPVSSTTSSDILRIYLPDNLATQPYSPVNDHNNLVVQFLPALSAGDRDFGVGFFSDGRVLTTSSPTKYYYEIYMRYGGMLAGRDYMLQISEYNTATSSFYLPTSPDRQLIDWHYNYYPTIHNWYYREVFYIKSYTRFRSVQLLHTTTTVSDYQTLTINYKPYGSLSAYSTDRQIALRLSVEARYHDSDGGVTAIYTSDGKTLVSGNQYSGVVLNPNNNEVNTIQFGQPSIQNAPLRFVLAKQSSYTDNTPYTWIIPLIKNPSTAFVSLRYNLTLVVSPANSYEYIFNHYQSLNEYYTVADTSTSFSTLITNNLRAVQTSNNVDLSVNLGSYSLQQWDTAIFKINNALNGLTPSIATPNDTSNYNYYYFKTLNMIVAQKKSTSVLSTIGIGASSSSIDYQSTFGLSWVRIFNTSDSSTVYNPYTLLYSTPPTLTLTHLTTYASASVSLVQGYDSQGSTAYYQATFTTPIIVQTGEIRILFDNSKFSSAIDMPCRPGNGFSRSSTDSIALRCYRTSQGFRMVGFSQISASTSVSVFFKLRSTSAVTNSLISADVYGIYDDNNTRVSLAQLGSITITSGSVLNSLYKFQSVTIPYWATIYSNNYYLVEGSFNLRDTTIQNGDYIYITDPGWTASGRRRLLIKQNSSLVTGWTELDAHSAGTNRFGFKLPSNNLISQAANTNTQYLFRYTTYYSDSDSGYYNGFVVGGPGVAKFWVQAYHSGYTETGYFDFMAFPQANVLTVTNRYRAAGRQTVIDLLFSLNVDLSAGSEIVVRFDTNNLLYQMFQDDLEGEGTNGETYRYLDCNQWANWTVISNSKIVCLLHFGNRLANPPRPANLTIRVNNLINGYPSADSVRILIANVKNPTQVGLNTGIRVTTDITCSNQQNLPCSSFQARGYYVTASATENVLTSSTTFSSSSPLVLTTGLTHTFTLNFPNPLGTSDAIYIVYPENFQGVMPLTCSISSYNCYVFPTRRWVVLFPTTTILAGPKTLNIANMNNPYYAKPYSLYFKVTVARSGAVADVYYIEQNAFTPVSYTFTNSAVATSLSVSTTQTPNMYLRNYANTVVFTISNIFSDSRIKALYIKAPADVTVWDPTYCNASITNSQNFNYPLRFICIVDPATPNFLRLTLDADMNAYSASWATMSIRLHAKFTLIDFPTSPILYSTSPVTSGAFYVYSSMNATSSSELYYMSQCSVTVSISQNQVPIISVINFNTQSFANRLARVNNKQVFYLLFKPLVGVTMGSVVFTIPSEFNYPGVFSLDKCLMIGRTTETQSNCKLSRFQGQTLVTLTPDNYDNNVKIFQIGSVQQTNWFTAPNLPGDFYNMNVAVYANNGTLVTKQTKNISPVYGRNLDIPSIVVNNVQDYQTTFATYDIRFVTGDLQIPPGAPTTATTQTSQLQFIFENFNGMNPTNVFSNDLGTGLSTGSQIGCVIQSGLVALAGQRIKCLLTVGTSQTSKPTISIINYNFINPGTTIIVSFARIQTLPSVLVNTISIGAKIFYNDIGSSTYLYIPTPVITNPTNASNVLSNTCSSWKSEWAVNCSYSSTNIVLEPTVFSISFKVPYYALCVVGGLSAQNLTNYGQYTYSSSGAADEFILLTFYPSILLDKNNPLTVSCPTCTSVDVFYSAGMVRFRHSRSISGYNNYITFTFTNFPTSSYALLNQAVTVNFKIFQKYQCIYNTNISTSLSRTVEKCTKFNFGVISVSSLNGGEIGVTYIFSIKTNHFVPANGALSITLPIQYGNMLTNKATCTLVGFGDTNCYCRINTPSRIDIYSNGTELSTSTTYSVRITGLQNPNIDSSNFVFIVTSYYDQNIYLGLKICENQIVPPTINIKPLRTCTLSWTPQYSNQRFNATYVFQLSCSDVFRGDSTLFIALPQAFSTTNSIGTLPCSSYESTTLVQPLCTLSNIDNVFTLSTSIDASSQSSLSLIINLVNPINNTYSARAYVTSKGTQYASSSNSSITILSNSYLRAAQRDVALLNTPKEAGLSSTYVFKISPVSGFSPSNLGLTFPSNFNLDSSKITVAIANTELNNLFASLTYNNMQALISNSTPISGTWISAYPSFSVSGSSVYLTNITRQVSSSKWSYVFVSGVNNPSAYTYANFTIAYYLISQGFQALQWLYQFPLTYYISPPPQYVSIEKVTVSDLDLLYPSDYTFTFSATGSNIAMAGRNLSYIIVIPTFYKSTLWANTPPVCKFAQLSSPSTCYSYQSQIIVTEAFPTNYNNLTLTISTLLNPSLPTTCNTTDTSLLTQTFFIIRIIDTLSNSFLYESSSVVDSTNCLTFSAVRIPISLEYPLIMTAGLTYNITYGLTKPSSNLKITASVDNPGFTFSPSIVNFNDFYTLTKTTQLFLRSDISAGSYVINFRKSQTTTITYFRNILPVTITVQAASNVSSTNTPTISIPSMTDSTIGYPVVIPILFSIPSSTQMTMFLTIAEESNQTLAQYSSHFANFSITPRIINIMPQQTGYNFTIRQGMRVVPPPLALNLKITSNYPIVHRLTTPTMYLCFDRDPRHNVLYPPLRVTLTPFLSSCNQQDVGKTVTNIMVSNSSSESSAGSVTPKIIGITVVSVASTGATLRINSITSGQIYYLCIPAGYPTVKDSSVLVNMNNQHGKVGTGVSSALTVASGSTAQVNFVSTAEVSGLNPSSSYVFYAVIRSNLGTSAIVSITFNTTKLSNGAKMILYFTSIVPTLDLVNALVQVMRITPTRVKVLTSIFKLQQKMAAITSNDNQVLYGYEVVLAPDPVNDVVSPLSILASFATNKQTLATFKTYLPSFDYSSQIKYFELMPVLPIVVEMPQPVSIKLYSASFRMKFKAEATVYAVLYEHVGKASPTLSILENPITPILVGSMTSAQRARVPSSNQIVAGTDQTNTALGAYKVLKQNTDEKGVGHINWQDLKPQSVYEVFVTAATPRAYDPPLVWSNERVIAFNFSTLPNPNIGNTTKQEQAVKQFAKYNPKLAQAMQRFIELNKRKEDITSSSSNRNK